MIGRRRWRKSALIVVEVVDDRSLLEQLGRSSFALRPHEQVVDRVSVRTQRAFASAQEAVRQADEMWRKLREASLLIISRQGLFDTIEPLLAEQALNQARNDYLNQVIEYNRAQFRLYWALGQPPLCALPNAASLPVVVPVQPETYKPRPSANTKP